MVGGEVLQFARAESSGAGRWRLSGLLRGRGGTEPAAIAGHPAGAQVLLLDDRLTPLDPAQVPATAGSRIAASGIADPAPVMASLANPGLSRQPLMPVHPRLKVLADGAWDISWTRRARGQWRWNDDVDVPLVEQTESYLVGYGPPAAPLATWTRAEPSFRLAADERSALLVQAGPASLWVRQIGTHALSPALPLGILT